MTVNFELRTVNEEAECTYALLAAGGVSELRVARRHIGRLDYCRLGPDQLSLPAPGPERHSVHGKAAAHAWIAVRAPHVFTARAAGGRNHAHRERRMPLWPSAPRRTTGGTPGRGDRGLFPSGPVDRHRSKRRGFR